MFTLFTNVSSLTKTDLSQGIAFYHFSAILFQMAIYILRAQDSPSHAKETDSEMAFPIRGEETHESGLKFRETRIFFNNQLSPRIFFLSF